MTARCIAKHDDHLPNNLVQIDWLSSRFTSTVEQAIAVDDTGGTFRIIDDSRQRSAGLFKAGWFASDPLQAGLGIERDPGNRLLDLVSQRRRQFSHHAHTVDAREISLQLAQSPTLLLGAFAF